MALCVSIVDTVTGGQGLVSDSSSVRIPRLLVPDTVSDPTTCAYVLVSGQNYKDLVGSVGAFDYTFAAALFAFFFSFTVGMWFVSKNIGLILSAVKRW